MDPNTDEQEEFSQLFGFGRAGEPVPQVDPSDMKALWTLGEETKQRYPEGGVAIGVELLESLCKPGANIGAISYRAQMIGMLQLRAPEMMDPLIKDKLDAVLAVASVVPMEWIGTGIVHEGWPFDSDDFVRRVREAA